MSFNFQNFYIFVLLFGIVVFYHGASIGKSNWVSGLIFMIFGIFLFGYSIFKWSDRQKSEDKLIKLDVVRKDATLDFDIEKIDGKNDIDYEPESFDEFDNPVGVKIVKTLELEINIRVYNPCLIENTIKNVEVSIKQKDIIKKLEIIGFSPISIEPRKHSSINFKCYTSNFQGENKDKILIGITTMDNKKIEKEKIISSYRIGEDLKNIN